VVSPMFVNASYAVAFGWVVVVMTMIMIMMMMVVVDGHHAHLMKEGRDLRPLG
jgi:hypothetical protein